MAITLSTIFNFFSTPFKLKLHAGEKGLNQSVSWVYYTENPETIEFIRGGELAITTGLNLERKKWNEGIDSEAEVSSFLKEFIDSFLMHKASGLIVNTGKYIKSIPQEITDYCNSKNFPLFSMPWEIHTIDIMQDIGNMISTHNQNASSLERFFYKAIFESENFDFKQIENTAFHDTKLYSIALMEFQEQPFGNDIEQLKRYISIFLNPKMNFPQENFCCFIHKKKIIYVIRENNIQFSKELLKIIKTDKYFKDAKISLSDYTQSIEELPAIYNHAQIAMKLGKGNSKSHLYEDMGIFKILADVKNIKTLKNIQNEVFGKLNVLELEKREDYLKTLNLFLKFGGNLQMVAESNNVHRNTVIYRISRLEELLGVDLSDGETRCFIHTAFYIKELLSH